MTLHFFPALFLARRAYTTVRIDIIFSLSLFAKGSMSNYFRFFLARL